MKATYINLLATIALLALQTGHAADEDPEERPLPGSQAPPAQDDEGDLAEEDALPDNSIPHIRVWNFCGPLADDGIGVFLYKGSRIPPPDKRQWLARGSRPGEMRDYQEVSPGKYKLGVIHDPSRQGAMVQLSEQEERVLAMPEAVISVTPSTFTTVLLTPGDREISAEILLDHEAAIKSLRFFNFSNSKSFHTRSIHQSAPPEPTTVNTTPKVVPLPAGLGELSLSVTLQAEDSKNPGPFTLMGDISRYRSASVAAFQDRYGRGTVLMVRDAPLQEQTAAP